eukprot:11157029-Lingulodinium_polyedra.AAC.1
MSAMPPPQVLQRKHCRIDTTAIRPDCQSPMSSLALPWRANGQVPATGGRHEMPTSAGDLALADSTAVDRQALPPRPTARALAA